MKPIASFILLLFFFSFDQLVAGVLVTGVKTDGVDGSYSADASSTDLVNAGSATLSSATLSATAHFGATAHNNGIVGAANTTAQITFWLNAAVNNTYSITYTLNTAVNTLGYDINSIQTINAWTGNSGAQKNQNYQVFVSTVGSASFTPLASVTYNPYTTANNTASTKVNITEDSTGILATGIDEIRFTYTVAIGGTQPSPTIREIDVFGVASVPDVTAPTVSTLSPADDAMDVSIDSNLLITFNEAIAIGSGDITIKNLDAPSSIAIPIGDAQMTVTGPTLTINPSANLSPNTNYAIQIADTAIDDLAGNGFAGITTDTTWNFTTKPPDIIAPAVSTLSPADNSLAVSRDGNLVVTFDEAIAIGSGDITIKNLDAPSQIAIPVGDPQITISGAVMTINPATDLNLSTNYAIQIADTAIDDLAGNSFAGITNDTTWNFTTTGILITTTKTDGVDAAYGADASSTDLVNTGASSLASTTLSTPAHFGPLGPLAHNNGSVGFANIPDDITFWLGASVGSTYSITYSLDTSVNNLGYEITSIQTINGWTTSSGAQKNQNYEVFVSTVGDPGFTSLATVAYNPYGTESTTASTKVNITQGVTGLLASGVDQIRFTYTVSIGGSNPSPTIREIDVFGTATPGANSYANWIDDFSVGGLTALDDDFDKDGIGNGLENFFGTNPSVFSNGLVSGTVGGGTFTFIHPQGTMASDLTAVYQWSKNLTTFHANGATDVDATKVDFTTLANNPGPGFTTVTATVTGTATDRLFVRVLVTQP